MAMGTDYDVFNALLDAAYEREENRKEAESFNAASKKASSPDIAPESDPIADAYAAKTKQYFRSHLVC